MPVDPMSTMMLGPMGGMMRNRQNAGRYQSQVDEIANRLRQAQLAGAPPTVISGLQAQLQQAQRAMQQAGQTEMFNQMRQNMMTGYGGGSVGGRGRGGHPGQSEIMGREMGNLDLQMLATMFGLGGPWSGGGPVG